LSIFDKTTEYVDVGSVDKLARILGAFDENLNFLARELGIVAYVDGVKIRLEGESQAVRIGGQVLNALVKMSENGEEIDKGRMAYCIELSKEGRAGEMATLESGVVAITARGKQIKCKTVGQKAYVDAIKKDTVVFGVGPAGTGKTYLAVCMAVSAFKSRQVEKIILTRPAVEAGEKLGFLPGDLHEKVDPYLRPLYDALQELLGLETYGKLMERGAIEVAPLAYARQNAVQRLYHFGRSAKHDERTDENVPNPYGRGEQGSGDGRRYPNRFRRQGERSCARDEGTGRRGRDCGVPSNGKRRSKASACHADYTRLRKGCGKS